MIARTTLVCLLIAAGPTGARAQDPDSTGARAAARIDAGDAWRGVAVVASTLVLVPADRQIADWLAQPPRQDSGTLQNVSEVFRAYGVAGTLGLSGSLYAAGWLTDSPQLATVGLRGAEAITASQLATFAVKFLAGRARPDENPERPYDFRFGRGLTHGEQFQSFPSGHTAAAFAFAAAVTLESHRASPRSTRYVAPVAYAGAVFAGLSRMYDARHWASDVAAGAVIGTLAGLAVVRWHDGGGHGLDRQLLPRAALGADGALLLVWSVKPRSAAFAR